MIYRPLGKTGIHVSAIAFGAGPVPDLMTGEAAQKQRDTIRRAIAAGINWFDTAATYGDGASERSLGMAVRELPEEPAGPEIHVATKVRLMPDQLTSITAAVRASVTGSLARLGMQRVTLLQLHNSITAVRDDEPTSITPADVLGPGGVLDAFHRLQSAGLVEHIGLTGLGQPDALRTVISSGQFATVQTPYNLLNPSAGRSMPDAFEETDFGNVIADCAAREMGVFAIRVYAGGALSGQPPSRHTQTTRFFPIDLYRRDERRAARLIDRLGTGTDLRELAVRFALSHPQISSAIIGFGESEHVDDALRYLEAGPLPANLLKSLESA
jgi:aryl-alcohol dehydrogenase-like predicted oxidoreductase